MYTQAVHRRQILLLSALALLFCGVAAGLWRRAFPLATLDFRVTRGEAQAQLAGFVEGMGHSLKGYRAVPSFGEDTDTKNFLELEYGVPQLEQMTREGMNIWYWTVRWFRPEQHEEFSAGLDPQGRTVGYWHTIEEERALPSLDRAAALALAEGFLRKYAPHHPWEKVRFVSDSSTVRTNRVDWNFQWERVDLHVGDAIYRIHCGVQGNEIGNFSESLEVPEAWKRSFAEKREVNELCATIAGWGLLPIVIGAFVYFIIYARRGSLRWRDVAPRTWLVVFALSMLASQINELPALLAQYDTTDKWGSFLSETAFNTLRGMIMAACGMWFLLLIADPFYRELLPQHLSFRKALSGAALDDPRTLRALGVGVVLATFGLAYVTTFYVVSRHFGAWSPVEIDYAKTLGGWLPWAEAMQTGFTAAFGEELLFRVIGVLLYVKLIRRWPVGLVLAGVTWAFLHSTYPQMPGYIRGLELTVEGVLWGVMMMRFGIVSTLTAHYLYDCWLGSYIVLQSAAWYDKAGALVVSLWPVALLGYGLWRRGARAGRAVPHRGTRGAGRAAAAAAGAAARARVEDCPAAPLGPRTLARGRRRGARPRHHPLFAAPAGGDEAPRQARPAARDDRRPGR